MPHLEVSSRALTVPHVIAVADRSRLVPLPRLVIPEMIVYFGFGREVATLLIALFVAGVRLTVLFNMRSSVWELILLRFVDTVLRWTFALGTCLVSRDEIVYLRARLTDRSLSSWPAVSQRVVWSPARLHCHVHRLLGNADRMRPFQEHGVHPYLPFHRRHVCCLSSHGASLSAS